jgi:phage tail tape-measure protein
MIRTAEDVEEQKARIAKLQKEAEKEERNDNTIVIQFAEGSEEYAR